MASAPLTKSLTWLQARAANAPALRSSGRQMVRVNATLKPSLEVSRPRVSVSGVRSAAPLRCSERSLRSKRLLINAAGRQQVGATGAADAVKPWTLKVGESALLVRFGTKIDLAVSERLLSCLTQLEQAEWLEGVGEVLPAYASLLVNFDPLVVSSGEVEKWILGSVNSTSTTQAPPSREIEIPVNYGGDNGVDIDDVAELTGLPDADAVAKAHADGDYRVYFLGFLGGFPYLGGLQEPLASVPRLSTPRPRLAKGTVGIAQGQTGVYTVSSPGGWHCLGKTAMNLFDPSQDPPAILRAGDKIKFVPTEEAPKEESTREVPYPEPSTPWVQVLEPGMQTSVQDLGRYGYAKHGVTHSGAADELAVRMANALVGNDANAAVLEVMMGGLRVKVSGDAAVALTGASCAANIRRNGKTMALPPNETVYVKAGDQVVLNRPTDGMRSYLAVQGGVDVPEVLGSRSTDVRGGLGGYQGRPLRKGDVIGRLPGTELEEPLVCQQDPMRSSSDKAAGPSKKSRERTGGEARGLEAGLNALGARTAEPREWVLRVVKGPADPSSEAGAEQPNDVFALTQGPYNVSPRLDRMAVVLGRTARSPVIEGGQIMSEACVSGTVQLPPDGNPVILLAEHQTTGGYKTPAVVIEADLWRVGQMRPRDTVRFKQVNETVAVEALKEMRAQAVDVVPIPPPAPPPAAPVSVTEAPPPKKFDPWALIPRSGSSLKRIDLNADAGEGFDDAGLMQYVTSVNVSCGGHVGTPEAIAKTVELAAKADVAIGAHPSYMDQEGWGRVKLDVSAAELRDQIIYQVSALQGLCQAYGTRVRYIKPHGALYHTVLEGGEQGEAVKEAARMLQLPLLLMPKSSMASFGEGFSERAYDGDSLRPRDQEGAVIHEPEEAAVQAVKLAGSPNIHSICVHGDSPNAVNVAKAVRAALDEGFDVSSFV